MAERGSWSDQRIEIVIGNMLRAGVILSAAVVFAGGALYLVKFGGHKPHYGAFHGEPSDLRGVSQIVEQALSLHARGLIQLGLLLLIATPVARVAFSVAGFAAEKDWLYVGVTLIVLAVLLYSLMSG